MSIKSHLTGWAVGWPMEKLMLSGKGLLCVSSRPGLGKNKGTVFPESR